MKQPHFFAAAALLIVLLASTSARADTIFFANMTHSQEVTQGTLLTSSGAPRPLSFGTAIFVLNDSMTTLSFTATIFNIDVTGTQTPNDTNDNLTAAHIHAPAPPGTNAGVRWGFFGTPDNDNNPDNLILTPFMSGVGGTISSVWDMPEGNGGTTLTAQLTNILSGLSYINFHTVQFPGGEIRGQINAVPEPATMLLLATGLAGVGATVRKRRGKKE